MQVIQSTTLNVHHIAYDITRPKKILYMLSYMRRSMFLFKQGISIDIDLEFSVPLKKDK